MHTYKIITYVILGILLAQPVLAEDSLIYARQFEVPAPKKEAPKLIAFVLPEEMELRETPTKKLLLPIEADPAAAIQPDVVE